MKKLTTLLLLYCNHSFGQPNSIQSPTQFDAFISDPRVEWAAYINDSLRFDKPGLNKILAARFEKNEIKATFPVTFGINNQSKIAFTNKRLVDKRISPPVEIPIYDSTGNNNGTVTKPGTRIEIPESSPTLITEVLFIEKGELKSYVPMLSPMLRIVTNSGVDLGYAAYFSTCFNFNHNYQTTKQSKTQFLYRSNRNIPLDSIRPEFKLKEMYGRNLLQTLWPYILQNKFEIISLKTGSTIRSQQLKGELLSDISISVPVYDEKGNITGHKFPLEELSADNFTKATLVQDWYYDQTKNIVFTKTMELYLYARRSTKDGLNAEANPILKIVLNK